jgi:hypothetical protein
LIFSQDLSISYGSFDSELNSSGGYNYALKINGDITLVSGFGDDLDISEPCEVVLEFNEFNLIINEGDSGDVSGCSENGSFCQEDFEMTYGSSLPSFFTFSTDGSFTYTSPSESEIWISENICEMAGIQITGT